MSFLPLNAYQKRASASLAAVTMAYAKGKPAVAGQRAWRSVTRLHFWPGRMTNAPSWLGAAKSVSVDIGIDKDVGYIRISPGGVFKICYAPRGKNNGDGEILCILIEPLPEVRDGNFGPDACDYSVFKENGPQEIMLIDLPDWAYATSAGKPAPIPAFTYKLGAPSHAAVNKGRGVSEA
jgi:hypothetical protein